MEVDMKKHSGNTGRVLNYMRTHKSISSKVAFDKFGATRLSAIIFSLRKQGYIINNIHKKSKNRFGESVIYDEYVLTGEPEE